MPRSILALLAGTALLASGCGGDNRSDPADYSPEIEESERRLGAEQHPQLLAEFGGSYDESEASYLARIGDKVASAAGLEGQCTFTLVNSDVVNAFAVPGCYIYVTRGLFGLVNSEAELASILAHEVGHIVGDHGERQQKRSLWRGLGVMAVGLLTGSEKLARIAGGAAEYFTLRYSRKQEYESDDLGIHYLKRAGYDPEAAADMLDALARHEQFLARTRGRDEARSIPEWARTHPLTENRIERARGTAVATGVAANQLPENEEAYLREVDGLLYGDDPAQGFVQGRRFAHPLMRIAFEAPEGFTLTNSPKAILIDGPDGLRGEFGGGPMPPGGLEAYASALIEQLLQGAPAQVGTAQAALVNGVPALFVPIMVGTPQGDVELSLAAYRGRGGEAYHFMMISSPSQARAAALGQLFGSFRLLSDQEVAALKPRVIRVVPARPGDDLQTMARRMASENPMEHFLVLNGRSPDQPLRPGERVKIVTLAR
ncbi:MAG TPA: M48 family metalloprotease [Allosphingosinicella sp.]|nr:M48 family metalloprotease [Allosphingosinicella sp.]